MDLNVKIDPELAPALEMMPREGMDFNNLPSVREMSDKMFAEMAAMMPPVEGVEASDRQVPGPEGCPEVGVRVYTPKGSAEPLPGLLWIHGGGYIVGNLEADDHTMRRMCSEVGCVIVSTDYRLAPENPFPAAMEDCYAVLRWMIGASDSLGIDASRVAIGGGSAGGGLAAGLALYARDRAEVDVAFQLLIYPMIDDRNITPSSRAVTDPRTWDREKNRFAWRAYLGEAAGRKDVSAYAAASRAMDLSGLPPAYIAVGELDLFLDENIEYAQRLLQAGVSTELHVYPGAPHGFDAIAGASVSKRFVDERNDALRKALEIHTQDMKKID